MLTFVVFFVLTVSNTQALGKSRGATEGKKGLAPPEVRFSKPVLISKDRRIFRRERRIDWKAQLRFAAMKMFFKVGGKH
jgi:hypothetical protein